MASSRFQTRSSQLGRPVATVWSADQTISAIGLPTGLRDTGSGTVGALSGHSVSSAGDVNGDGFDDLIIGTFEVNQSGVNSQEGESYVVFGKSGGFAASISLSSLDGTNGFVLTGIDPGDLSGSSASSAGDVNGDGFDDLVIGTPFADQSGADSREGESYVVFGGNFTGGIETQVGTGAADTLSSQSWGPTWTMTSQCGMFTPLRIGPAISFFE